MKKILFLLILIYSYSFATDQQTLTNFLKNNQCIPVTYNNTSYYKSSPLNPPSNAVNGTIVNRATINVSTLPYSKGSSTYQFSGSWYLTAQQGITYTQCSARPVPLANDSDVNFCGSVTSIVNGTRLYLCDKTTGDFNYAPNPDPLGGSQCRDLFQKDGVAYTCNPNSNEATAIPNSEGTILDPDSPSGKDKPNCNEGFESSSTITVAGGGNSSYVSWSCIAKTPTPPNGNTGGTGGTGEPSISYGGDGSITMTLPDGTRQTTYGDGWVTTTYPDGTTSSTPPRTGGSGGSGSSGGGTGGTSGNTTNEDNTTPSTDTPIDNTPVANSCSDSNLTLQEKMLCELNAGMKKQNSEGAPQNSLNQLLKDLKTSNQTDNTAINTNLKDVVSGTAQLVNKQTEANATLKNINDSANATELYTKVMADDLRKISGQLEADPNTPSTGNALEGSGNIIDSLASTFTEFKDNMKNQGDTLSNLISSANNTVNQGFTLTVNNSNLQTCPKSYILDLSSMGLTNQTVVIDICYVASMLKPFLYPIFLILMTISLTFFTFKMIGVLL